MKYPLPEALLDSLKRIAAPKIPAFIQLHESEETLTSIRINPAKPSSVFLKEEAIAWSKTGKYLADKLKRRSTSLSTSTSYSTCL